MSEPVFTQRPTPTVDAQDPIKTPDTRRDPMKAALRGATMAAGEAALSPGAQPGFDAQSAALAPKGPDAASDFGARGFRPLGAPSVAPVAARYPEQDLLREQYFRATGVKVSERDDPTTGERSWEMDGRWVDEVAFARLAQAKLAGGGACWDQGTAKLLAQQYVMAVPRIIKCDGWEDTCRHEGERASDPDAMHHVASGMAVSGPAIRGAAKVSGIATTFAAGLATASGALAGAGLGDTLLGAASFGTDVGGHLAGEAMQTPHPHPNLPGAQAKRAEQRKAAALKRENVGRFVESQRPDAPADLREAVWKLVQGML